MLKFLQQQQQQQQPQTQQSIGVHPAAANDDSAQHVVRDFWETVGREQPWWGVLTQPLYSGQGELEPAAKEAFFATGSAEVAFIDDVLRTHGGLGGGLGYPYGGYTGTGANTGSTASKATSGSGATKATGGATKADTKGKDAKGKDIAKRGAKKKGCC